MLFLAYLGSWWSYYPNIILVGFTWLHQSCLHFNTPFLHQCTVNRYCQVQGCLPLREKRSSHYFYWCDHIWFIYDSYMIPIWSGIWKPRSAKTPRSLIASTWAIQGHWSTTVIRGMPHRMEQNGHASTIKMYIIQYQHLLWGRETLQQMEMNFDFSQY